MTSFFHFMFSGIIYIVITSLGNFYFYPRITVVRGINENVVSLIDVRKRVISFEVYQSYFVYFILSSSSFGLNLVLKLVLLLLTIIWNDVLCVVFFTICSKSSTSILLLGNKKAIKSTSILSRIFFTC